MADLKSAFAANPKALAPAQETGAALLSGNVQVPSVPAGAVTPMQGQQPNPQQVNVPGVSPGAITPVNNLQTSPDIMDMLNDPDSAANRSPAGGQASPSPSASPSAQASPAANPLEGLSFDQIAKLSFDDMVNISKAKVIPFAGIETRKVGNEWQFRHAAEDYDLFGKKTGSNTKAQWQSFSTEEGQKLAGMLREQYDQFAGAPSAILPMIGSALAPELAGAAKLAMAGEASAAAASQGSGWLASLARVLGATGGGVAGGNLGDKLAETIYGPDRAQMLREVGGTSQPGSMMGVVTGGLQAVGEIAGGLVNAYLNKKESQAKAAGVLRDAIGRPSVGGGVSPAQAEAMAKNIGVSLTPGQLLQGVEGSSAVITNEARAMAGDVGAEAMIQAQHTKNLQALDKAMSDFKEVVAPGVDSSKPLPIESLFTDPKNPTIQRNFVQSMIQSQKQELSGMRETVLDIAKKNPQATTVSEEAVMASIDDTLTRAFKDTPYVKDGKIDLNAVQELMASKSPYDRDLQVIFQRRAALQNRFQSPPSYANDSVMPGATPLRNMGGATSGTGSAFTDPFARETVTEQTQFGKFNEEASKGSTQQMGLPGFRQPLNDNQGARVSLSPKFSAPNADPIPNASSWQQQSFPGMEGEPVSSSPAGNGQLPLYATSTREKFTIPDALNPANYSDPAQKAEIEAARSDFIRRAVAARTELNVAMGQGKISRNMSAGELFKLVDDFQNVADKMGAYEGVASRNSQNTAQIAHNMRLLESQVTEDIMRQANMPETAARAQMLKDNYAKGIDSWNRMASLVGGNLDSISQVALKAPTADYALLWNTMSPDQKGQLSAKLMDTIRQEAIQATPGAIINPDGVRQNSLSLLQRYIGNDRARQNLTLMFGDDMVKNLQGALTVSQQMTKLPPNVNPQVEYGMVAPYIETLRSVKAEGGPVVNSVIGLGKMMEKMFQRPGHEVYNQMLSRQLSGVIQDLEATAQGAANPKMRALEKTIKYGSGGTGGLLYMGKDLIGR